MLKKFNGSLIHQDELKLVSYSSVLKIFFKIVFNFFFLTCYEEIKGIFS